MGSIGLLFVIRQAQTAFPSLMALTTLPKLDTNLVAQIIMPKGGILFSSRVPIGYLAIAADELATNQGFKSMIPDEKMRSVHLLFPSTL